MSTTKWLMPLREYLPCVDRIIYLAIERRWLQNSGRKPAEFIDLLVSHGVKVVLAPIRQHQCLPGARHNDGCDNAD